MAAAKTFSKGYFYYGYALEEKLTRPSSPICHVFKKTFESRILCMQSSLFLKIIKRIFMNKKKMGFFIFCFIFCFVNAPFVQQVKAAEDKGFYHGKITIGYVVFPGYFPLIIADKMGYFKEAVWMLKLNSMSV